MLWLDNYERRARLAPGLLALMPIAITVAAFGLRKLPVVSLVFSTLVLAGGPLLLSEYVRQRGRETQKKLWDSWGGSPTTQLLRLRAESANPVQRERWRKALEKVTEVRLSAIRSERAKPDHADALIEAAVAQLRDMTRDTNKFALLYAENKSYGFHRNLYAIRNLARSITLGCALALGGNIAWHVIVDDRGPKLYGPTTIGLVINLLFLLGWVLLPTLSSVREAAYRYAEQLLHSGVVVANEPPPVLDMLQPPVPRQPLENRTPPQDAGPQ